MLSLHHAVERLLAGDVQTVLVGERVSVNAPVAPGTGLLPGAFDPLHKGHVKLADVASQKLGAPVLFELSVANVDKPMLDVETILDRLGQFARPVVLACAALYRQKAALFPGCVFVIGYDTAERLFDPRYYGDSEVELQGALKEIEAAGCYFLVAGRVDKEGIYRTVDDLAPPPGFRGLLEGIPEEEFRVDISSTALRGAS